LVVVAETKVSSLISFVCVCESNQAVSAKTKTPRRADLNLRADIREKFRLRHMHHDIAEEFAGQILTFSITHKSEISVTDTGGTFSEPAATTLDDFDIWVQCYYRPLSCNAAAGVQDAPAGASSVPNCWVE